jgi:C4-dicarboxylate-specific signal transduction histidine kinase
MQDQPCVNPEEPSAQRVEAARYALLRRLAHAMRHHMVVHLQPIGMITEVLERRLQAGTADLAQVHESMTKINGFSKAAVQSSLDMITWLAPDDSAVVPLQAGVEECLSLLRSAFSFRGFTVRDEIGSVDVPVPRAGLRNILPACLLALTDRARSPADVVLAMEAPSTTSVTLVVSVRSSDGSGGFSGDAPYRLLEWYEVEAMAGADRVGLVRSDSTVRLTFPIAAA